MNKAFAFYYDNDILDDEIAEFKNCQNDDMADLAAYAKILIMEENSDGYSYDSSGIDEDMITDSYEAKDMLKKGKEIAKKRIELLTKYIFDCDKYLG